MLLIKHMNYLKWHIFFEMAEKSGLYVKGTYGTPISHALSKLTFVDTITADGEYCYSVFRLRK